MDPNLIHLDWERTFEALTIVVVLAFVVERALALLFESDPLIRHLECRGLKEGIALVVSIAVCWTWKFDAVSMFLLTEQTSIPGYILTGAVVAGGSKASIKLFHDVFNIRSSSSELRYDIRAAAAADRAQAAQEKLSKAQGSVEREKLARETERLAKEAQASAEKVGTEAAKKFATAAKKAATEARKGVTAAPAAGG